MERYTIKNRRQAQSPIGHNVVRSCGGRIERLKDKNDLEDRREYMKKVFPTVFF